MAINKNFVIKNGVQVSTDLIIGDADNNKVGIGTTIPGYDLHVGRGRKSRGGIGATDLVVTGVATINQLGVTGISTFTGALDVNSTVDFAGDVVFNGTNDITFDQSESALVLNDGAALRVGTGSDFSILHDGNNTILRDNGTGDLQIYASRIELGGASVDETIAMFTENGGAQLFFNNVNKFETTGVGATVFGDLVVSGVTTSARLLVTGISTFSDNVDVNAHVFVGTGVTIQSFGGVSIAGITTVGGNLLAGGDILPDDDGARDLGSASKEFQDLFIDGTANIDALVADSAKVSDLTDNRVVIAGSAGELEDSGNLTFDGSTLAVTGDETVSGKITVGSGVTVQANGAGAFAGIVTANGGLKVGSNANTGIAVSIFTNGNATFSGIVTVGGDLNLHGDLILGNESSDTITPTGRFNADILPASDGAIDLGATGLEFQDLFIDGTANIDSLAADTAAIGDLTDNRVVIAGSSGELEDDANLTFDGAKFNVGSGVTIQPHGGVSIAGITTINGATLLGSTLAVAGVTSLGGNVDLGNASGDTISFTGRVDTDIIPSSDGAVDLGASGTEFKDLFIDGTANIDALAADTAAIGDLTDNRVVIAGSSGELEDDANFTFDGSKLNVGSGVATVTTNGNAAFAGIVTANRGFNIGIQSAGIIVAENVGITTLNFVGSGNSITYHASHSKLDISIGGSGGGGGGVSETETSVSTTSATSCGTFDKTEKRSAAVLAQITQGSAYQVGRYLVIHDGTTVTTIEEAAVATGDMLGTFEGVINGDNVEFRVTMSSSSSATVTTKIDSISIP